LGIVIFSTHNAIGNIEKFEQKKAMAIFARKGSAKDFLYTQISISK